MEMSSNCSTKSSKSVKIPLVRKEELHSNSDTGDNPLSTIIAQQTTHLSKAPPCNSSPCRWTTSSIYTLISACKLNCNQKAQGKSYNDAAKLWSDISKTLCQTGKFIYTPEQCRTKWLLLKQLYYHVTTEEHLQKFEFCKNLHEIFEDPRIDELFKTYQRRKRKNRKHASTESFRQEESKQERHSVAKKEDIEKEDVEEETHIEVEFLTELSNLEQEKEIDFIEPTDVNFEIEAKTDVGEIQEYTVDSSEELQPKKEAESYDHSALLHGKLSTDELPAYAQQFKEVIELQEQRRDERHREKLKLIREQSERFLAQQKAAILMHRLIMEQLIDSLES